MIDGTRLLELASLKAMMLGVIRHTPSDIGEVRRAAPSQASCSQSSVKAAWPPRATIDAFCDLKSMSSSVPSARQPKLIRH